MSLGDKKEDVKISVELIKNYMADKMTEASVFFDAKSFEVKDIWSKEKTIVEGCVFSSGPLAACDNKTVVIKPVK